MSTLTLQPDSAAGVDARLESGANQFVNFGTSLTLNVGYVSGKGATNNRSVLRFDLTSLPAGAAIVDTTLTLFNTTSTIPGSVTFYANRVTSGESDHAPWTELGASWVSYEATYDWDVPGGDYTTADRDSCTISSPANLVFANLKNLAIDAVANRAGVLDLLILGPENQASTKVFRGSSSDGATPSTRPQLVVNYTLPAILSHPGTAGRMQELVGNLGA